MSTSSPEEAHGETVIPWPAQAEEPSTEKDSGEQVKRDASAELESNEEAVVARAERRKHGNGDEMGANQENAQHGMPAETWLGYIASPDFWNRTLQNWQSEFLAVGAMIAFSIYLRQRGCSESKPVGTPHHTSSVESE